ncbi:MAG: serine hydrolase [Polyangia bacterium]
MLQLSPSFLRRRRARWLLPLGVLFLLAAPSAGLGPLPEAQAAKPRRAAPIKHQGKNRGKHRRPAVSRAVPVYTRAGLPNIQAQSAVVVDLERGVPLYEKNPDAVRPIASISKLMAMLVVMERRIGTTGRGLDLDAKTTITETDARLTARGAKSRLLVGMSLSNRDLLHAALMASDNRAVLALGRAVGLSPPALAAEMTAKARALGLSKTEFHDPTGLDYRNVSTPREVVKMLVAALKEPLIAQICRTAHFVAHALPPRRDAIEYTNTDHLVRTSRHHVLGGKTGYNDRAGYCLVVAARIPAGPDKKGEKREREVAMAFLGAEGELTRFADFGRAAQWLAERRPLLTSADDTPREQPGAAGRTPSRPEHSRPL